MRAEDREPAGPRSTQTQVIGPATASCEKTAEPGELLAMLRPHPPEEMEAIPIGRRIGNVKFDDSLLIEPVTVAEAVKRGAA